MENAVVTRSSVVKRAASDLLARERCWCGAPAAELVIDYAAQGRERSKGRCATHSEYKPASHAERMLQLDAAARGLRS